jgi:hypothetical protein
MKTILFLLIISLFALSFSAHAQKKEKKNQMTYAKMPAPPHAFVINLNTGLDWQERSHFGHNSGIYNTNFLLEYKFQNIYSAFLGYNWNHLSVPKRTLYQVIDYNYVDDHNQLVFGASFDWIQLILRNAPVQTSSGGNRVWRTKIRPFWGWPMGIKAHLASNKTQLMLGLADDTKFSLFSRFEFGLNFGKYNHSKSKKVIYYQYIPIVQFFGAVEAAYGWGNNLGGVGSVTGKIGFRFFFHIKK